jgi:hypothetical protein
MCWPGGRRDCRFVTINCGGLAKRHPPILAPILAPRRPTLRCAPYELLERYRSDPAWFLNHGWASRRKYPKRPHAKGTADSFVYKKFSTGTPPAGPQIAKGNVTITATGGANHTNFGGVYGHTLTASEAGSNDLTTVTAADPTGLLVATPVEDDPNFVSVREYKGY